MATVETRVARIADALLAERQFVTPVDVLVGLGWLAQANVDRWTKGRISSLSLCIGVDDAKTTSALDALRIWAERTGVHGWPTDYRDLQFTADPVTDDAFHVRWALTEDAAPSPPPKRSDELIVVSAHGAWVCTTCGDSGDELMVKTNDGTLCLNCADLGHLTFLPSGDAALTRRARKLSGLFAVVVRWSKSRSRYERQGILVEIDAVEQAERDCLDDADARARRRDRDRLRRAAIDETFCAEFATAIRDQFPGCPPARADAIAYHSALRGSGRVGRSAAARRLDPDAIRIAVTASVRHVDTDYDDLLMSGIDRDDARRRVYERVDRVLDTWRDDAVALDL